MRYGKLGNTHMSEEQLQNFFGYVFSDDLDFYEEYTIHLSDEEQEDFFRENPEFMSDFPIIRKRIYMLKDKSFRDFLREVIVYKNSQKIIVDFLAGHTCNGML